jgi:hypothetical protein
VPRGNKMLVMMRSASDSRWVSRCGAATFTPWRSWPTGSASDGANGRWPHNVGIARRLWLIDRTVETTAVASWARSASGVRRPSSGFRAPSRDCFREPSNRARHGRPEQDLVVVVGPADYYPFDKGWRLVSHPSTQLGRNDRVPVPVDDGHRHLAVGQMLTRPADCRVLRRL